MRLRRPCIHDRYETHPLPGAMILGSAGMAFADEDWCPGGEFLPEDALVIEKVEAERIIARAIAGYHETVGDAVDAAGIIVEALASHVEEV